MLQNITSLNIKILTENEKALKQLATSERPEILGSQRDCRQPTKLIVTTCTCLHLDDEIPREIKHFHT